jgi:hypothetical protein
MPAARDKPAPDYRKMAPGKMLRALGDDGHAWATAFCQHYPQADHELMWTWFANCIEASSEVRRLHAKS